MNGLHKETIRALGREMQNRLGPRCPHCGTNWTQWQQRGYDKHPCNDWRNDPYANWNGTDTYGQWEAKAMARLEEIATGAWMEQE